MSKKKIKNLLNQSDIKDLINESIMLREFSMYGCDDQPNKVHGYNPFSKKCVDITGYEGPNAPKSILRNKEKPQRDKQIGSVLDSKGKFADFVWGIYTDGVDYKEITDCVTNNPVFSFLGLFYGRGTIKILPMLAQFGGRAAYSAFTQAGKLQSQIDTYVSARRGRPSGLTNFIEKIAKGAISGGYKAGKWGSVAAVMAAYFVFNKARKDSDGENYADWSNKILDSMEKNIEGNDSKQNWKCFFASAVTGVVAGVLARGGARGLLKMAKNVKNGRWNVAADIIKSQQMRNWFRNSIKNIKSDQLIIFKVLQESGALPGRVKIVVDKSSGLNRLKVKNLGDTPIRFRADGYGPELQKYAVNGEIVLDPAKLSDELTAVSDEINQTVQAASGESLSFLRNSDFYNNVRAFTKAMSKYGDMPPMMIRSKALQNTSEILQGLTKSLESSLQSIKSLQQKVLKGRDQTRKLFDDIDDLSGQKGFETIERQILDSSTKFDDIENIVDAALPGLDQVPTSFVGGRQVDVREFVLDHFKQSKNLDTTKKGIISDVEFARKAILEETGVVKSLMSGGSGKDDLAAWLSSDVGSPYRGFWNKLDSNGDRLSKLAAAFGPKMQGAVTSLFTSAAVPIGAFTLGVNLMSFFSDKKITDKEQLKEVIRLIDEQVVKVDISKYTDEEDNIKVDTLLSDLMKKVLSNKDSFMTDTQSSLEQFEASLKNNDKYIKEINKFVNDQPTLLTKLELRRKIKAVVTGTLFPNENKVQETREVLHMNKKDIKQLVAEVLNEGYAKYPYNSNEHSEDEPDEDYMVEWSSLVDEVCGNKKKNFDGDPKTFEDAAVEVAKLFIKDSELFREVLELAGSNKSVGVEILQQLKAAKEKSLDKEPKI